MTYRLCIKPLEQAVVSCAQFLAVSRGNGKFQSPVLVMEPKIKLQVTKYSLGSGCESHCQVQGFRQRREQESLFH